MAFISQNEINKIRAATSIVDIISSYIPLTQKGKNYFGVCPFHEDHSPSMSVSEEKQIYKCFSCGATGNVFTFVQNYLNISFFEAVINIANKVGINVESNFLPKKESKYKTEYEIMELSMKFFQNNLNTLEGKKAVEYLNQRGLNEAVIKEFEIGLSLTKNTLYQILINKNFKENMLEELGLINKKNTTIADVFQNRIMFPIHDLEGRVVGFTARNYLENENGPKYLNTKETIIFKKGAILFNYHRAKNDIRLNKEIIIVEGNMDAIRLYANGIKNVIALMGTSLTKEQIFALQKLHVKIILMLDNDEAGENATLTIGNLLEENHLNFEIVRLSGEKDPDEYILKNGKESMLQNIKNAISFIDFKLNYFKKNKNLNDAADLADYIKTIINSLNNTNDDILKEVTLQKLSNDYNISYTVLKNQLNSEKKEKSVIYEKKEEKQISKKSNLQRIINEILFFMMNDRKYIEMYQKQLGIFPEKKDRSIANEIIYYYESNNSINLADFITYIENNNLKEEIMNIIKENNMKELSENAFNELLVKFNKIIKEKKIKELKELLQKEFDINKKIEITEKIAELKKGSVENESY